MDILFGGLTLFDERGPTPRERGKKKAKTKFFLNQLKYIFINKQNEMGVFNFKQKKIAIDLNQ